MLRGARVTVRDGKGGRTVWDVVFIERLTTLAALSHAVRRLLMSSVGVARVAASSAGAAARILARCILVVVVQVARDFVGDGV